MSEIHDSNFFPLDPAVLKPGQLVIRIGDKMFPVGLVILDPDGTENQE